MLIRSKSGSSAYGAALMKATEMFVPPRQRLFEDPVILSCLPGPLRFAIQRRWFRERFMATLDRGAPGVRGTLLCRTRYVDDAVTDAITRGLRVVVILGAGLDTRPYRLSALRTARILEADLPAVQQFKKARLARHFGALPSHVQFVPLDFTVDRLNTRLAEAGLDPHEPAMFVWEGVTQYLPPDSVDEVLQVVAAHAKGSEVVFTYVLNEAVTQQFRPDRDEAFRKAASRHPEQWYFGIEASLIRRFLSDRGLTLLEDAGAKEHSARYLRPTGRELLISEIERIARACV